MKAYEEKDVEPAEIIEAARIYGERWRLIKMDPHYTPHPASWLNGERWEDDIDDSLPLPQPVRSKTDIIFQQNMEGLARTCEEEGTDFQDMVDMMFGRKPKPAPVFDPDIW